MRPGLRILLSHTNTRTQNIQEEGKKRKKIEGKNIAKHPQNIYCYYYKLVPATECRLQVEESGQLTCHAPVTFRSVELDFLVGTENPIRLLYSTAPRTPDKTKQGVPRPRERVLSAFLAFLGQRCEIEGRFYL